MQKKTKMQKKGKKRQKRFFDFILKNRGTTVCFLSRIEETKTGSRTDGSGAEKDAREAAHWRNHHSGQDNPTRQGN